MKTFPYLIRESREFVCETWGEGEETVTFYAPLTRVDGVLWIHPAWAREATWAAITARADRIWRVTGSFWNPLAFHLIWNTHRPAIPHAASLPPDSRLPLQPQKRP